MNERILTKLVIQSSDKDGWLDREKFAELIVQECIECCNQVIAKAVDRLCSKDVTESGRVLNEGTKGGAINSKFLIMDRFGVE